jgi:uncharacterized caspase-like protein
VHPNSDPSTVQDGIELLKHAIAECPNLGDAWYYRSLLERKSGNGRIADYALGKARENNSEALQQSLNPFSFATPPNGVPAGAVHDKWALVIGIGSFRQHEIPALRFTTKDASAFAEALRDPRIGRFKSDHVVTLTDSQATTRNIKEKLNWLARSAGPNDLVVIYIATHGTARDMDTRGVNYIITYDTEVGKNMDNEDALFATALPMVDVANTVASRVTAQRTAIFLDTCYSGAAAVPTNKLIAPGVPSASVSTDTLARMSQGTGRAILAASQGDEESLEDTALGHGYFTYYLLEAMKRSQGQDTLAKIYPYVREQVMTRAQTKWKAQQIPVMSESNQGGQIVIGTAASSGSMTGGN